MALELKNYHKLRHRFLTRFAKRLPLRFHMSLIVAATVGAGLLATKGLHWLNVENVAIRYPLSVLFAYCAFFLIVELWLKYVSYTLHPAAQNHASPDILDILPDIPLGDITPINADILLPADFAGFQGGGSGGGGALRSFGETSSLSGGDGIGDTVVEGAGSVLSGVDDEVGIAVIVLIAILAMVLAVIFGCGLYLIYQAPMILSETAFDCILAAGLVRGTRKLEQANWMGSILQRTWIPFTLTLFLTLIAGLLIHSYFPEVTSLRELYRLFFTS